MFIGGAPCLVARPEIGKTEARNGVEQWKDIWTQGVA